MALAATPAPTNHRALALGVRSLRSGHPRGRHLSWGLRAPPAPSVLRVLFSAARSDTARIHRGRAFHRPSLSAFGVSHPLDGLLLATPRRFVSPGWHPWGSPDSEPLGRSQACAQFPEHRYRGSSPRSRRTPRSAHPRAGRPRAASATAAHAQPSSFLLGARSARVVHAGEGVLAGSPPRRRAPRCRPSHFRSHARVAPL